MPLDALSASTPLGDYLRQEWLPRKLLGWASGSRRYRQWAVDILCESSLVDRPIGDITALEIERYFAERAAIPFRRTGKLPTRGSIHCLFATLKASLSDAERYDIIRENPCKKVRLPPNFSTPTPTWSPDQVRVFLAHTSATRYAVLWRVLFATGMRRGEALGLTWRHIDFETGRLTVVRAMLADSRRDNIVYGPPKNHRSMRTITIDPGTLAMLRDWQDQLRGEAEDRGEVLDLDSSVFVRADGMPMLPAGVSHAFRQQVKAAGLPPIPLHSSRHCHISHLLAVGEPITHVAARAGHSSSAMTLRIYAHVIATDDERTAARAGQMFALSSEPQSPEAQE